MDAKNPYQLKGTSSSKVSFAWRFCLFDAWKKVPKICSPNGDLMVAHHGAVRKKSREKTKIQVYSVHLSFRGVYRV